MTVVRREGRSNGPKLKLPNLAATKLVSLFQRHDLHLDRSAFMRPTACYCRDQMTVIIIA